MQPFALTEFGTGLQIYRQLAVDMNHSSQFPRFHSTQYLLHPGVKKINEIRTQLKSGAGGTLIQIGQLGAGKSHRFFKEHMAAAVESGACARVVECWRRGDVNNIRPGAVNKAFNRMSHGFDRKLPRKIVRERGVDVGHSYQFRLG
jgi:hypothetical protein